MKTLVVERDGRITVHEVNKPRYNEYQALVKTIACGMCGTDIKLIHRTFKGFPESVYPIMLGHEGVGEVVEVGSKVKGLKVGDKVLLPFVDPDPENLPGLGSGWGALSEYAVVCDPKAPWPGGAPDCAFAQTVLDDDLDPVDATMIVTFREVLSNIRYFGIQPQDSVVVFGCGPVGLTYLKFMSLLGVKDLVACDILPEKLEQARNYGATHLINSKECDVRAEVRKLFPGGVDYVLDAAGSPAIVNQGMGLIKDRGSVLCYGVPEKEEVTIDFSPADYNWRVIYQQMPRKREEGEAHAQVVEWMRSGELNIKDFISDCFRRFAPAFLFAGVNIFSSALFTALSDGRTSAIISFARTFGFLLLGLLLLPRLLEVDGVWLAVPLAELLSCLLSVWFLRRKRADFGFGGGELPRHGGRGGGRI